MYIFPEIGHNSVKNLLITLDYEVTIYEEHLLTSVVILYQRRLKKVHMSGRSMISPIIWCQLSIGNQNVNIPKFPQKYITLEICTLVGVRTCLASPLTGNKGTV